MVRQIEVVMLAQRALLALTPRISDVADEAGVPYRTFRSWRDGIRSPSPDALRMIAGMADQRADVLRGLAVELRRVADADERHS